MKDLIKSLGNAVIILIVGISPMGIGAVMIVFADTKYAGVIMNLFILAGSLLCLYVMKKQFGINIRDNAAKPPLIPALFIAAAALLYEISALLTVYKPLTSVGHSGMSALDVIEWISAVFVGSANIPFRHTLAAGRGKRALPEERCRSHSDLSDVVGDTFPGQSPQAL